MGSHFRRSFPQAKLDGSLQVKGKVISICLEGRLIFTKKNKTLLLQFLLFYFYFRKELKDPEQLYTTLKSILQHVKVKDKPVKTCTPHLFMFLNSSLHVSEPPKRLALHGTREENRGTGLLPSHSLSHGYVLSTNEEPTHVSLLSLI